MRDELFDGNEDEIERGFPGLAPLHLARQGRDRDAALLAHLHDPLRMQPEDRSPTSCRSRL